MNRSKYILVAYILLALLLTPFVASARHVISDGGVVGNYVGQLGLIFLMGFASQVMVRIIHLRLRG